MTDEHKDKTQNEFMRSQQESQDKFVQSQVDEFKRFEDTVTVLNGVLETHRDELNKAKNVAKKGVIVGIVGIIVGLIGTVVGIDSRNIANDVVTARAKSTISSCIQSNVATQGTRNALTSAILALAKDPAHLNSEEQAALAAYTARVNQALPYRDCSPAGISKYFMSPPPDPAK